MLTLSPENVFFIIVKAREFDVTDAISEPSESSDAAGEIMISVLEDNRDDAEESELKSYIDTLNEDEQVDLVALCWLGRGEGSGDDWTSIRKEAVRAHNEHTSDYLLGMPLLGDYLEEGLSMLGYSSEDYEASRR